MNNTNRVLNYLATNSKYHYTVNQLVGNLNLTTNTVIDALNTLIKQGKIKSFSFNSKEYYRIK